MIKAIIDKTQFVFTAIKNCFLTCRKTSAVIIATASGFLAWILFDDYLSLFGETSTADTSASDGTKGGASNSAHASIIASIFLILLALPISFYFWVLRNHDKLKQIEQAEASNNHSSLSNAMRLFLEKDNKKANAIGLKLLMELRHVKQLKEQIDLATPDADLCGVKLASAKLTGARLKGADLTGAKLNGADLSDADLAQADLIKAKLERANLSNANLDEADLSLAELTDAKLEGSLLDGAMLAIPESHAAKYIYLDYPRSDLEDFLKSREYPDGSIDYQKVIIFYDDGKEIYRFLPIEHKNRGGE